VYYDRIINVFDVPVISLRPQLKELLNLPGRNHCEIYPAKRLIKKPPHWGTNSRGGFV